MTTIYLIRHAEAEGNVYRRCHGQYDSLLTPRGLKQLPHIAKRFETVELDAVYASDLYRARHTAKAIADAKGIKVRIRPALREINMGEWEDKTWAVLPREYEQAYEIWRARPWECHIPAGELVQQAGRRLLTGLRQIAAGHAGGTVAVVSHGSAIRSALCEILGLPPEKVGEIGWGDNTCVAKLEFEGAQCQAEYWNDASHLPAELSTFASIGWKDHKGVPSTVQIWFRPYSPEDAQDQALFLHFMRELYRNAYGTDEKFSADEKLALAAKATAVSPRAVTFGMLEDKPVALAFMNASDLSDPSVGMVGGFCIDQAYRGCGLSQQILGQAISVYRQLGREWLCANVAAHNERAKGFYKKFCFEKRGELQNECGMHETMCKRIKVDALEEEGEQFLR